MGVYKDYFLNYFPKEAIPDILRQTFLGYSTNSKFIKAQELQPGPAKNVFPYNRCAHIDNNLLALNNKYEGLSAKSKLNSAHNWRYTLISYKNIRMTASSVASAIDPPRESAFRNYYASCQYRFDENITSGKLELCDLIPIEDGIIYALIIHCPTIDNPQLPAFINIAFPNESLTGYLERIKLFDEYPSLVESLMIEGREYIPDNADVKLNIQEKLV